MQLMMWMRARGAARIGKAALQRHAILGRLQPEHAAEMRGKRIELCMSVPISNGVIPAASAAAAPPLEPPGVRSIFHGLLVLPNSGLLDLEIGEQHRGVGLAEQDRACRLEARRHDAVFGGHVFGKRRKPDGGAHARRSHAHPSA